MSDRIRENIRLYLGDYCNLSTSPSFYSAINDLIEVNNRNEELEKIVKKARLVTDSIWDLGESLKFIKEEDG